jgi:hypothetical protein
VKGLMAMWHSLKFISHLFEVCVLQIMLKN